MLNGPWRLPAASLICTRDPAGSAVPPPQTGPRAAGPGSNRLAGTSDPADNGDMGTLVGRDAELARLRGLLHLSLIHISEPTRLGMISYAVFCLKKKNN